MNKFLKVVFYIFIASNCYAQISAKTGIFMAKEFSKEIALYRAKAFAITEVLGASDKQVQFQIDPLAAASSGELTSLVYQCEEKKKEGMILGFYGDRVTEAGVSYKAFVFKDLPKAKALELLNKIEKAIDENSKFINKEDDVNNVYFNYDDLLFLIYHDSKIKIRVFYNEFDSEWDATAFKRTKRRLLKQLE